MPIKRRVTTPPRKQAHSSVAKALTSPLLSANEKHQLILAHAVARKPPPDPAKRMSMWAGVIVCVMLIVTGWFFTVGHGIKKLLAAPMAPELTSAAASFRKLSEPSPLRENETNLVGALKKASEESEAKREMFMEILTPLVTATPTVPVAPVGDSSTSTKKVTP